MKRRVCYITAGAFAILVAGIPAIAQSYELIRVPADPAKGFHFAYFLSIPNSVVQPPVLLVESNNTGSVSDDQAIHEASAENTIRWRSTDPDISRLGCPILVPTFPRPASNWRMYTHALDRDTLLTDDPQLERIDLQLVAMIDDAKSRLAAKGITVDSKVFLYGFSASGTFCNRFPFLHPEVVRAASCGGVSMPTLPVSEYKGKTLPYPIGIADLEALTGRPFQAEEFRKVAMMLFRGDQDTNDEVAYSDGFDNAERALVYELFGGPPPFLRYRIIEGLCNSVTSLLRLVILPGVAHGFGDQPSETVEFFNRRRTDSTIPLPAKPLIYRLYFAHIAGPLWETELGLVSNMVGVTISGRLEAYDAAGQGPRDVVPVNLPPSGRKVFRVASTFRDSDDIAYVVFVSDSGFVNGYTRFTQKGSAVMVPATSGSKSGAFPRASQDGWDGFAFVNLGSTETTLELEALDDMGRTQAGATRILQAKEKAVGGADSWFGSSVPAATHYRYRSTEKVAGFCIGGMHDGSVLEGTPHGLPLYVYQ